MKNIPKKIILKKEAFESLDSDFIHKVLALTLQGLLIPEQDLKMLSKIDFDELEKINEKFNNDSLTYDDINDIATVIVHNYAYPHDNLNNLNTLLGKTLKYWDNLVSNIERNLKAIGR